MNNAHLRVENCILSGNYCEEEGGTICARNGSAVDMYNSVVWNNSLGGDAGDPGASALVDTNSTIRWHHSLIDNSDVGLIDYALLSDLGEDMGGNTQEIPYFVDPMDPSLAPNLAGDYHATFESSALIDQGSDSYVTTADDLEFNSRIRGDSVDRGCFESNDGDGDGVTQYEEEKIYGTSDRESDSDGDGADDGDELFVGTDLLDASSVFAATVTEIDGMDVTMTWPSSDDLYYTVEGCSNLVSGEWFPIKGYDGNAPTNTQTFSTDGNATYFRLKADERIP